MQNTNKPSVYVSYARKDNKQTDIINNLVTHLPDIYFHIDKNEVRDGQSFLEFIEAMSKADYLLLVLGKDYFESYWCMYELTKITHSNRGLEERIFVIRDSDFKINENANQIMVKNYWQEMLEHANDVPRRPDHLHKDGDIEGITNIHSLLSDTLKNIFPVQGREHDIFLSETELQLNERSGFDRIREWLRSCLPELKLTEREPVSAQNFQKALKGSLRNILLKHGFLREELEYELEGDTSDARKIADEILNQNKYIFLDSILPRVVKSSLQQARDIDEEKYQDLKIDIKELINIISVLCVDGNIHSKSIMDANGTAEILSDNPTAQVLAIGGFSRIKPQPEYDRDNKQIKGKHEIRYAKPSSCIDNNAVVNDCLCTIYNTVFEKDNLVAQKDANSLLDYVDRKILNDRIKREAKNHTGHYYFLNRQNNDTTSIFAGQSQGQGLVKELKDKLPALDFFIAKNPLGDLGLFIVDESDLMGAYTYLINKIENEW